MILFNHIWRGSCEQQEVYWFNRTLKQSNRDKHWHCQIHKRLGNTHIRLDERTQSYSIKCFCHVQLILNPVLDTLQQFPMQLASERQVVPGHHLALWWTCTHWCTSVWWMCVGISSVSVYSLFKISRTAEYGTRVRFQGIWLGGQLSFLWSTDLLFFV